MFITVLSFWVLLAGTYAPLKCHDCTDKSCDLLLRKELSGKCRAKRGGKCFIRQDPNGRECFIGVCVVRFRCSDMIVLTAMI